MATKSHRSSGLIPLLSVWGVPRIGATIVLVERRASVARTKERIASGVGQDYFRNQIEDLRGGRVARTVSGRLVKPDEVDGLQTGLL